MSRDARSQALVRSWSSRAAVRLRPRRRQHGHRRRRRMIAGSGRVVRCGTYLHTNDGIALWHRVAGAADGPTLVYLHGGPCWGTYDFEQSAGRLLERSSRVVYFDQRGCSRSTRGATDANLTMDATVDDLERLRPPRADEATAVPDTGRGRATQPQHRPRDHGALGADLRRGLGGRRERGRVRRVHGQRPRSLVAQRPQVEAQPRHHLACPRALARIGGEQPLMLGWRQHLVEVRRDRERLGERISESDWQMVAELALRGDAGSRSGVNASSARPSRKGRLNERTTRPLGSSESRELATGDRAP
jgi:hypothetical protein